VSESKSKGVVAIDLDGTYLLEPGMWYEISRVLQRWGFEVVLATGREGRTPDLDRFVKYFPPGAPVLFCGIVPKQQAVRKKGFDPIIWIDDAPASISTPAKHPKTMKTNNTPPKPDNATRETSGEGLDDAICCALVDALIDVLPQHAMACVSGLNLHEKPWSYDVTDEGSPLVTRDSCQCSGDSTRYLRGLLPDGHPKGFSHNNQDGEQICGL